MRRFVQRGVKRAAATADRLRPPSPGVVALLYHRVGGGSGLEVDLPAPAFERQMEILAEEREVLDLDGAARLLASPGAERRPGAVVTFDDGTADFVDRALPVLDHHRIPAVVYVATAFVEEGRPFPHEGIPLSWAALRDALSTGLVTVGSHTHTHALLDRLPPAAAAAELERSAGLIADRLGIPARHFAYPKAVPGSAAVELEVRRRFDTAALAGTRPNPYGRTDLHRLRRSPIQVGDGEVWFRRKLAGGMGLEDDVRRVVNRWRYAGSTT